MTLSYRSDNTYTISSVSSSYYLYGSMNNFVENDSNYKMYSYNGKHYGFLDLSESATIKISNRYSQRFHNQVKRRNRAPRYRA